MSLELYETGPATEASSHARWVAAGEKAGTGDGGDAPFPAGARTVVALRDGEPVARAAFGVREGFVGADGVTGYIGWYAAAESGAGAAVLHWATAELQQAGATLVVAPLDGSTWYRYRVTLPADDVAQNEPPFLSEPRNPAEWVAQFADAGFSPLLEYETRLVRDPAPDPALGPRREELRERGVTIRPLALERYQEELAALHALSLTAFADNPFYLPLPPAEFDALYRPLRRLVDPALVLLAEDAAGELVGYVFAFDDPLAPAGGPRVVLKTLAVRPDARGWGLGSILVDEIHSVASARGAAVLHALMHVTNASRRISGKSESELFRRYVLFATRTG